MYDAININKYIFVGLGNPEAGYAQTRHNLGIAALKYWVDSLGNRATAGPWHLDQKINGEVAKIATADAVTLCLFPQTFMNESGKALAALLKISPVSLDHIVVLHDDIELPLGRVEITVGGSAKGHNGVRSIYTHVNGQNIIRIRLGVGRPADSIEAKDFVLAKFTDDEKPIVKEMITKTTEYLSSIFFNGISDFTSQRQLQE